MSRWKSLVRRVLVTRWLMGQARVLMLCRNHRAAAEVLHRVVTLAPASFGAHFLLGRVGLALDTLRDAVQEFAICSRLDPERFSRARIPQGVRAAVATRCRLPAESCLSDVLSGEAPLPGEWDDLMEAPPLARREPPRGDFTGAAEWLRFRDLPPIGPEEVAGVDLDQLAARLQLHPNSGTPRDS